MGQDTSIVVSSSLYSACIDGVATGAENIAILCARMTCKAIDLACL
jgi:hypothetical protein